MAVRTILGVLVSSTHVVVVTTDPILRITSSSTCASRSASKVAPMTSFVCSAHAWASAGRIRAICYLLGVDVGVGNRWTTGVGGSRSNNSAAIPRSRISVWNARSSLVHLLESTGIPELLHDVDRQAFDLLACLDD